MESWNISPMAAAVTAVVFILIAMSTRASAALIEQTFVVSNASSWLNLACTFATFLKTLNQHCRSELLTSHCMV